MKNPAGKRPMPAAPASYANGNTELTALKRFNPTPLVKPYPFFTILSTARYFACFLLCGYLTKSNENRQFFTPALAGRREQSFPETVNKGNSIDQLVPHSVHDQPGDGLGAHLGLHVLPDRFDGTGTEKYFFGDLLSRFVFCQEL